MTLHVVATRDVGPAEVVLRAMLKRVLAGEVQDVIVLGATATDDVSVHWSPMPWLRAAGLMTIAKQVLFRGLQVEQAPKPRST